MEYKKDKEQREKVRKNVCRQEWHSNLNHKDKLQRKKNEKRTNEGQNDTEEAIIGKKRVKGRIAKNTIFEKK